MAILALSKNESIDNQRFKFLKCQTQENIRPSCFASCGDDGYIKIWDPRLGTRSIYTNLDNANEKARVSVLKLTKENELLSGSCPDNVKKAQDKAQFSFWELRKLSY